MVLVDDVAEEQAGDEGDRARIRMMSAALHAQRWESLLDSGRAENLRTASAVGTAGAASSVGDLGGDSGGATSSGSGGGLEQRGVARYVYLILDMTDAARQPDYKPRRLEFMVEAAGRFARRFMAENPLSQLGLLVLRGGNCEIAAQCTGNNEEYTSQLLATAATGPRGRMSIVNGLLRAKGLLELAPPYGTREVILMFASLSTHDPGETPIEEVRVSLKDKHVRVSVVSMSPELYALRSVCNETGGSYAVALDSKHFDQLLSAHFLAPTGDAHTLRPKLIQMGFPRQVVEVSVPGLCSCHSKRCTRLFACPRCEARVCSMPSCCPMCELPLASAPLIARAFRQLAPVVEFHASPPPRPGAASRVCGGCQVSTAVGRQCPRCHMQFCDLCDSFIHGALRQCPGCAEVLGAQ
mmetsp:Transcript_101885/g.287475  ORF Transcript_101885/g.287475 Transcript_101885/m.287475 type:complete len:411 (-) Transcript_101885:63-1295(-)